MNSRPLGRAGEGPPVELPPLGEGMGRGFRRFGEGHLLAAVFVPAKAGLFERPKAAFFTVAANGVMHRMTVRMVETTRRKTRFSTIGATVHAKAKPPSATTAFCIYFITPHECKKKWGGHVIAPPQAAATLTELRFPSPGLRAKHATLGKRPH